MNRAQARKEIMSLLGQASISDDPIHERELRNDAALLADSYGIPDREFVSMAHSVSTGFAPTPNGEEITIERAVLQLANG